MKFVFLKSGDYLEFTLKQTKFINGFFDYIFTNNINKQYSGNVRHYRTREIEERLQTINKNIAGVNSAMSVIVPENTIRFTHNENLNQVWLNETHKKWVHLTHTYKDEIYDIPWELKSMWGEINDLVHYMEQNYSHDFENKILSKIPLSADLKVELEDCVFSNQGLCLGYSNLGRHQFNQWEVGTEIDDETNNYKVISTEVIYNFNMSEDVRGDPEIAPTAYADWCNKKNVPILGPWISLGNFKLSRFEVREIMHRNLKADPAVGFEL